MTVPDRFRARHVKLQDAGRCPQCRYDVRGILPPQTCPECGLSVGAPYVLPPSVIRARVTVACCLGLHWVVLIGSMLQASDDPRPAFIAGALSAVQFGITLALILVFTQPRTVVSALVVSLPPSLAAVLILRFLYLDILTGPPDAQGGIALLFASCGILPVMIIAWLLGWAVWTTLEAIRRPREAA